MQTLRTMLQSFQSIHPKTKRFLKFSAVYILIIACLSILFYILAGRALDYYGAMQWSNDLFLSIRPCVGVTALGGLMIEGALHSAQ